ncbi:MAG TPA: glucose-6-phosphate isomerase [Gemmatales bacterium]|nr:glucose-6-phosphate isomerase [Gemmatales bacterium]HMP58340.1 glucose-6-phosphate isomerase [Gemmatales bacterium]
MQLQDEAISFNYQNAIAPTRADEEWKPNVELQMQHFVSSTRLKALMPQLMQVKTQVATERELVDPPPSMRPLDAGFIDLPDKLLVDQRRNKERSDLSRIQNVASRLRGEVDRVVILGIGGSYLGAKALFDAVRSSFHNELPYESRMTIPRIYFEGNNFDNDAMQDMLELFQATCVNPDDTRERWATILISKSGATMETSAAFRILRKEVAELYGPKSEMLHKLIIPVCGVGDNPLRSLMHASGYIDDEIFTIPDRVGGRFSVFSVAGLLPAAVMGMDVKALLLGALSMTKQFLEEPFERNIVLQWAAINYLAQEELNKPLRVMAVWSKKLEALSMWYDQLLAESLGKQGRGPTPITSVMTRDLHSRGQQHQDGRRDKIINNVFVKTTKSAPLAIGMSDRNEDGLNEYSRKTMPVLMEAAHKGANEAYLEVARPTTDLVLPQLSEYTMGQVMQMLMLATVVEGRLMGLNPYGQPGVEAYKRKMRSILRSQQSMNTQNTAVERSQPVPSAG